MGRRRPKQPPPPPPLQQRHNDQHCSTATDSSSTGSCSTRTSASSSTIPLVPIALRAPSPQERGLLLQALPPPPPPAALLPLPSGPAPAVSARLNPQAREFRPCRISRAVQITGVPPDATDSLLLQELEQWGPIRDYKRIKGAADVLIVHFYDVRNAVAAVADIQEKASLYDSQQSSYILVPLSSRRGLLASYIVRADFCPPQVLTGPDARNQGKLVVFNIDPETPNSVLRAMFQPYGDIRQIRGPKPRDFRFIEFYDVRAARRAFVQLQGSLLNNRQLGIQYSTQDHRHQPTTLSFRTSIYFTESQPRPQYPHQFVRYRSPWRHRKLEAENAFNMDEPDESPRTTLMIRNIPNQLSQQALVEMLDGFCLKYNEPRDGRPCPEPMAAYDFVYIPMDFVSQANLGYAFVNCKNIATTKMLYQNLNGSVWEVLPCQKICRICYARIQGRAALLEHFDSARLPSHHAMTPYEYMPIVFNPPRDGRSNPRATLAINTLFERALLQRLTLPVQTPPVCIAMTTTSPQQHIAVGAM